MKCANSSISGIRYDSNYVGSEVPLNVNPTVCSLVIRKVGLES